MNKEIHVSLDSASIDAAIVELERYKERIERKTDELRERVAYFIAKDASAVFNTAAAEDDLREGVITGHVEVSVERKDAKTIVVFADGKDAIFMEFGAGVYYNGAVGTSPNPWGIGLGYTIGSYSRHKPGKEVWAYYDESGNVHLTHGTPASMPLYRAVQSVRQDILSIAREVFKA